MLKLTVAQRIVLIIGCAALCFAYLYRPIEYGQRGFIHGRHGQATAPAVRAKYPDVMFGRPVIIFMYMGKIGPDPTHLSYSDGRRNIEMLVVEMLAIVLAIITCLVALRKGAAHQDRVIIQFWAAAQALLLAVLYVSVFLLFDGVCGLSIVISGASLVFLGASARDERSRRAERTP